MEQNLILLKQSLCIFLVINLNREAHIKFITANQERTRKSGLHRGTYFVPVLNNFTFPYPYQVAGRPDGDMAVNAKLM